MRGYRRSSRAARSLALFIALLAGTWRTGATATAMRTSAGNSPWTGTFTTEMHQEYSVDQGAGSKDTITANCSMTIHRHADGTASATATYTSDESRTQITDAQSGSGSTTTIHQQGTASYPEYQQVPTFDLSGNGDYYVAAAGPQIQVQVTYTYQQTGSAAITQHYTAYVSCDNGGLSATRPLPGGTTVTGSTSETLLDGITITMEWTIQDSTLQSTGTSTTKKNQGPAGKIKLTPNGIDASLTYKGWEISYAGDWKKTPATKPNTAPEITSPDQKVTITFQEQPVSGMPSTGSAKATITQTANQAGNVNGISFKPFAIGSLTGQIGVITLANSPNILLITVVSDGQHQIITQTLVRPNTPPADLLEAGMALASIHQAGQ